MLSEAPLANIDLGLTTPCFQAFFKVVDRFDSLEPTWRNLQDTIARYKSENKQIPRDLYLTLLLIDVVPHSELPLLQLISSDPLVCRKIVLAATPGGISLALESLPFLSLGVSTARPAPGIPEIFKALEEQNYPRGVLDALSERTNTERMLARILDLPIPSELPHILVNQLSVPSDHDDDSQACRLDHLTICNFRGIRRADFDFSGNITVIYGPNGTGKTSVFDALEWALVGGVERLDADCRDDTSGRSPYLNLFSSDNASVEANLRTGGNSVQIRRLCDVTGDSQLSIDGLEHADDRQVLSTIVGQQSAKLDVRVLRKLVRTTSFLSQSTLKQFLSDEPQQRYWSLAHLLGTQDYIRILDRIDDLRKVIDRRINELGAALEVVGTDISAITAQIGARESLVSQSHGASDLDKELGETLKGSGERLSKLSSPYSTLFPEAYNARDAQSSLSIALDWAEKELRQEKLGTERLSLAGDAASRRIEIVAALQELSRKVSVTEAAIQAATDRLGQEEANKARKQADLKSISLVLEGLKDQQSKHRESLVITEQMKGLQTLAAEQQQQLKTLESELSKNARAKVGRIAELTNLTEKRQALAVELSDFRAQVESFDEAAGLSATYAQVALEKPSLAQRLRDSVAIIAEQQQAASDFGIRIASMRQETAGLSVERERQLAGLERFRSLVAEIQPFITASECPLCGHEWHSLDELKRAVNTRTGWISPRVKQLDEQIAQMQQRLAATEAALRHAEQEIGRLSAVRKDAESRVLEIDNMERRLRRFLIQAGLPEQVEIGPALQQFKERKHTELVSTSEAVARNEGELARLQDQLSLLEAETTRKQEVRERMAARLADTQRRLNGLIAQLANFNVSGEPDKETLQKQIEITSREIDASEADRAIILKDFTVSDSLVQDAKLAVESQRRAVEEDKRRLLTLQDSLRRVNESLLEAQLDLNCTPEDIRAILVQRSNRISGINDALESLRRLSQISSWMIARQEIQELNSKLKEISERTEGLRAESTTLGRWHSHLSGLSVALTTTKAEVENFQLEKYGPTINVLYQRLNTHPLFRELKVLVDAAAQSVRVNLSLSPSLAATPLADGLAPARYFSEAQLNIVALSIFLSHGFQQRWSRFVPLFLDDPVQNMDDFNANGFVDCLRSLAEADRQFVVSTCDLGLYRLLLLKLRCMNHDGVRRFRAYRLEGISDNGPRVVQDFPTPEQSEVQTGESPQGRVH